MRLLITGTGGFVGGYLSYYFRHYDITAIASRDLDLTDTNRVQKFFQEHGIFDAVINCAAQGRFQATAKDENILRTNLKIFANLMHNRSQYRQLINFGSGAEFGLSNNINLATEDSIYDYIPDESYGLSKNIIARWCDHVPEIYNIRIFGLFDKTEPPRRLISGFIEHAKNRQPFIVNNDRYADYVSARDLAILVDHTLKGDVTDSNINMVYKEKYRLSDLLRKYCNIHNIDENLINVASESTNNYTGSSSTIDKYNFKFNGLDAGLQEYQYE
jgi:nucleoside-diphosphate-sugar epimerase